jgi:8-oxo-dGTP pyrophosphatase MutT (NUDIX family)
MAKHSVGIIVFDGENVLLVKNTSESAYKEGIYGAPAGRPEPGEDEKSAAVRELSEETGLNTTENDLTEFPDNLYSAILDRKEGKVEYSIRFFLAKKYDGTLKESKETVPLWYPISNLDSIKLLPNVKHGIESAQKWLNQTNA